jgi:HK97 family phage prohead protease
VSGRPVQRLQVVQRLAPSAAALDAETLSVVASDESVDRYGDVIRVSGWELDNYRANPVVLFGHDSRQIVGSSEVRVKGKKLMSDITLAAPGTSPVVDMVRALIDQKLLKAVSVGFRPTKEPNVIRDEKNDRVTGYEFIGQELLELSLVSVPANAAALAVAKAFPVEVQRIVLAHDPEKVSEFVAQRRARIAALRSGASGR